MTIESPPSLPPVASTLARMRYGLALAALALGSVAPCYAQSVDDVRCGIIHSRGQFGPFDYRTATGEQRHLVESAHFSRETELLKKGTSQAAGPGPDIAYTLRAFPNHPRALKSMMDLRFRDKANPPPGMPFTAECWFNRAVRFTPDDPQVRLVYGIFLMRSGDKKGAVEQLEVARERGLSSGNFHYNLGLAYFQAQDYEKARLEAYKAKELGYELPGLKNLLTKAGQWREPEKNPPKDGGDAATRPPKAPGSTAETAIAPKN